MMGLIKFNNPAKENKTLKPVFFDDFFDDIFNYSLNNNQGWKDSPLCNIKETETEFYVEIAIPGFTKEHLQINLEKGVLNIKGEKKEKIEEKDLYHRREFSCNKFVRQFSLPKSVDVKLTEAELNDGVLSIKIPKKEEEKEKNFEVKIN